MSNSLTAQAKIQFSDYDAVSPPEEAVVAMFEAYLRANDEDGSGVVPIRGLYGAVKLPKRLPKIIVSVDLCEVLRRTGASCAVAMGNHHIEYPYDVATGLNDDTQIHALVRGLMKADMVPPTEGAAEVLEIMRAARSKGALLIGNTSTLPGCEAATIDFITQYYPGAFDGINFNTGGHHATERTRSKAWAVLSVIQQIDPEYQPGQADLKVFHIDDRPHHNAAFHEIFGGEACTYAPLCMGEATLDHGKSTVVSTPLAAFRLLQAKLAAL